MTSTPDIHKEYLRKSVKVEIDIGRVYYGKLTRYDSDFIELNPVLHESNGYSAPEIEAILNEGNTAKKLDQILLGKKYIRSIEPLETTGKKE